MGQASVCRIGPGPDVPQDRWYPIKFVDENIVRSFSDASVFAILGCGIILAVFFRGPIGEFLWMLLSSYETVLLPAFGLLIAGLALERDPVSKLSKKRPAGATWRLSRC